MIWIAMLLVMVLVLLTFVRASQKRTLAELRAKVEANKQNNSRYDPSYDADYKNYKEIAVRFGIGRLVGWALIAVIVVSLVASALVFVAAGTVGVQDMLGNVRPRVLPSGPGLKNPFAHIVEISTRTETYTMSKTHDEGAVKGDDSIPVLTKDGLQPPVDATVAYHVVEADAPWLYKTFGLGYVNDIVRPSVRTAIRSAAAQFPWEEIFSIKRGEYAGQIEEELKKSIKALIAKRGYNGEVIAVDQVMVRDIRPPDKVKAAIEEKLAEQQTAEKMEFTLAKERKEAERKLIEATGIRDFQRTVVEGVTPSLLTWRWIETMDKMATSQNKVFIIAPRDAPPIMMPAQ